MKCSESSWENGDSWKSFGVFHPDILAFFLHPKIVYIGLILDLKIIVFAALCAVVLMFLFKCVN